MYGRSIQGILAQVNTAVQAAPELTGFDKWWAEWQPVFVGLLYLFIIFILPFVVAYYVAKIVRMPSLASRIGLVLMAGFAAALFVAKGQLPLSIDMKGGTTLVYNIVQTENGEDLDPSALASALSERIDPSGTREITIRPRGGSQIEITVPTDDPFELEQIKATITTSGQLEFRVVANTRDHDNIITLARLQAKENRMDVIGGEGKPVGRWYAVGREAEMVQGIFPLRTQVFGDIIRNSETGELVTIPQLEDEDYALEKWLSSQNIKSIDVLMALEFIGRPYTEVFGDDLASAQRETSRLGEPIVGFRLAGDGAYKMLSLTTAIMPDGSFKRRMAIIMDKRVLSAPQVNSPISSAGLIEGRFTVPEIDFLVNILRSGRLPATLESIPASETRVGAALGEITIQKGTSASIWAVIATFVFMLAYYHFSGVVASLALLFNGLLIFGVLIFIRQPLSLPGLAGLVLTVGMAVDANVLIFERIREEKAKGSALRLSIRNGFDRAFSTIVDANITTIIAAIVLYWIGTEQVRGFAVTLIIGITASMFTAIFCSRIIFEIAEKLRLVSLSMVDGVGIIKKGLLGNKDVDFMGVSKACIAGSLIAIVVGLAAVFVRGTDLLNIDFTGGTTVTMQLEQAVPIEQLRQITKEILVDAEGKPFQSTLVRVEQEPQDTVFSLVTSMSDENMLADQLQEGLAKNNAANLVTYKATVTPLGFDGGNLFNKRRNRTRYVSISGVQEEQNGQTDQTEQANKVATTEQANQVEQATQNEQTGETGQPDQAGQPVQSAQAEQPAATDQTAPVVRSRFKLELSGSEEKDSTGQVRNMARRSPSKLKEDIVGAANQLKIELNPSLIVLVPEPRPQDWREDLDIAFSVWSVELPVAEADGQAVMSAVAEQIQKTPLWLSLSQIGGRVAGEMQQRALAAILVSLIFIVGYIWFRFQRLSYGLAAVVALVHDVLITLGIIALCHWLAAPLGFLLIEDFKIGLTEIAAFLTIIGYSLNDTIVVFDRIREVRGRSPRLTAEMLNQSINQTLSRTLLTSGTTLLTVIVLYVFGGEGIHAFAFALFIGIMVGTYSSIFIASPILLWLANRYENPARS